MKALVWHGTTDIRCDNVPDPKIEDSRDAIIKVTSCAICGSDLHPYGHFMPGMEAGDIMGHESMGEVVEVGAGAKSALKVGDRVVIPFTIICGQCDQCRRGNFSVCERSNRNKGLADKAFGHTTAGLFGYTRLTGGYAGGQAEDLRVPFADATHIKVPKGIPDMTGIAILASPDPAPWIGGRVLGDALDLATLAVGAGRAKGSETADVGLAVAMVAAVTALDILCAQGLDAETGGPATAVADYSGRSGFPKGVAAARGAARDVVVPRDMRVPDALRGDVFARGRHPSAASRRRRVRSPTSIGDAPFGTFAFFGKVHHRSTDRGGLPCTASPGLVREPVRLSFKRSSTIGR